MKVEFTEFNKGENWVSGLVNDGEFTFSSKLFDGGSIFGINEGRVSKLTIIIGENFNAFSKCIAHYDRGWDTKPESDNDVKVFNAVLEFLENAPKTRF